MPRFFSFISAWRRLDWMLLAAALALSLIGLTAIYSVDLSRGEGLKFFTTQAAALALGLAVLFIAASLPASFFEVNARWLYLAALVLLLAVLFFGTTVRGTTGWFRVAGLSFQPAELAKVALIIFLAWRIERQGRRFHSLEHVLATGALALLPTFLIILQPDFGSGAVLMSVWFGLLLVTGTKVRYLLGLLIAAGLVLAVGWLWLFQDYQKERFLTFLDPGRDPLGAGYNVNQSLIAVGAGKIFGRGLGFGSQSQLHFLPEAQTDFILSVIGEELGLLGLLIMLALYGVVLWRLSRIASRARTDFGSYAVIGSALLIFIQLIVNSGAALGFLPVTGVTLPLVSYGGSSLIMTFLLVGLAESAARTAPVMGQ